MSTRNLRLDYGDGTGPGKVGEILFWPTNSANNTAFWSSTDPARIALKYNDETRASSDPAYTPEYTILGVGKYASVPVTVGATYGVDIIRINGTKDSNPAFTITIPAGATTLNISTLTPSPIVQPTVDQIIDAAVAGRLTGGPLTGAAFDARVVAEVNDRARVDGTTKNMIATRGLAVALGTAATTPVDIAFVGGDSWVNSVNGGTWDGLMPSQFINAVRAGYQPSGVAGGKGFLPITNNIAQTDHYLTGTTGTGAVTQDYGLALDCLVMFAGATATMTIPVGTTGWDPVYTNVAAFSGQISLVLDGGAPVVVDTSLTNVGESGILYQGIRNLDPTRTHTLVITAVGNAILDGVVHYNGDETSGARVWNGGHSGYSLNMFLAKTGWETGLKRIQPKVIIAPSGNNDSYYGRTPTQYAADLVTFFARVRAQVSSSPVIVLPIYPNLNMSTSGFPYSDYVAVQKAAAAADPLIVTADISPFFGPWNNDTRGGLMGPDKVHPSGPGAYRLVAEAIWGALKVKVASYLGRKADLVGGLVPTSQLPATSQVSTFTGAQAATLWTKPTTAKWVEFELRGSGGGGGSGRKGITTVVRLGGSGGGGGGLTRLRVAASALPSSLYVTIGAAGTGGTAQATNSNSGNAGTAGGPALVSTSSSATLATALASAIATAGGGQGGVGGTTGTVTAQVGGSGATSAGGSGAGNTVTGASEGYFGGAGSGGTISTTNSRNPAGGAHALTDIGAADPSTGTSVAPANASDGTAGVSAATAPAAIASGLALGGSGGNSSIAGNGGTGGSGVNGGGGGGGGAGTDSVGNSGAGGNGGPGYVTITSY